MRWRLIIPLAIVVTLGAAGLFRFAAEIPVAVADQKTHADGIVVLTGGSQRLETGLNLLVDGKAERVLVSGVHPSVDRAKFLAIAGPAALALGERIDIGREASNTRGNARETAQWMRQHRYRSLRLVTSDYHMPRSILEFDAAMPSVTIIPHPVFSPTVKSGDWWRFPGTAALIISEYAKFLVAWTSNQLTSGHAADETAPS